MNTVPGSVSIIGSGAWGTTLALVANDKNIPVKLWTHDKAHKELMEKEHRNPLLADIHIPSEIKVYTEFSSDFFDSSVIILVVASKFLREVLTEIRTKLRSGTIVLSAVKGLEENSAKTPTTIIKEELSEPFHANLAVLSGPNIAREIAKKLPAATVVASGSPSVSRTVQELLSTSYFRVYAHQDITGVELGGIVKNIIAIAAGISDGLSLGTNAKAALMTRGMFEIAKFVTFMGAEPSTVLGLSGIGDLITTCSSPLSRNYRVGCELAKGQSINEIISQLGAVAEGVKTAKIVYDLMQNNNIDLPITEQVYNIIYNSIDPRIAMSNLMERTLKFENEGVPYGK